MRRIKKHTMKVYSYLERGAFHSNFNEDNLFYHSVSDQVIIGAVMDGCSSAKESHFASSLHKKSLHKSARILKNIQSVDNNIRLEEMELREIAGYMIRQLHEDLKRVKRQLFLSVDELLSTVILLVYKKDTRQGLICAIGDGVFAVNGELTIIDQQNAPNFLGLNLDEKFNGIDSSFVLSWQFNEVIDVAISTDGIQKLAPKPESTQGDLNPLDLLKTYPDSISSSEFYEGQMRRFVESGYIAQDDIAIIRLINED